MPQTETRPVQTSPTPRSDSPVESAPPQAAQIAQHTAPDPFDPTSLRIDQNFIEAAGARKLLTTVPVKKPHGQEWVRVRPEPGFRNPFALIQVRVDRDYYLIRPEVAAELVGEFFVAMVYTAINRQNTVFLWPVPLPGPNGRQYEWHRSAHEAADLAMTRWVRLKANQDLGAYEISEATGTIAEPVWPEHSFQGLLEIAFRAKLIDRPDHLVIRQLRGLA